MKLNIELPDNFKIEDYIDALESALWDVTTVGRYNPWPIVSGPFQMELMNVLVKTFKKMKNTNKNANSESKQNIEWISDVYNDGYPSYEH